MFDAVVIGAGVVGLACAEALAKDGHDVLICERHDRVGHETSSRNSGVLHAGIYYRPGSLKADLCLRGRKLLHERSRAGQVAVRPIGKLIVATSPDDLLRLAAIADNAKACGVALEQLDRRDVRQLEPRLQVLAALWSKESGIVDVDGLLSSLRRGALACGATLALGTTVRALARDSDAWTLDTTGRDGTEARIRAHFVVNACGLEADRVAALAGVDVDALGLRQVRCKGTYFALSRRAASGLARLIYPVPSGGGLGIHLTLDFDGSVRAGPDTEHGDELDYAVDDGKRSLFLDAVRRYLPDLRAEDLSPAYAGIRPRLTRGTDFRDFVIQHSSDAHLFGLINLAGIESPGLTASLAIAERVSGIVREQGAL